MIVVNGYETCYNPLVEVQLPNTCTEHRGPDIVSCELFWDIK